MSTGPSVDSALLEKLRKEVESNLTNEQFGVEELCRAIGMSRSQLHRKLNSTTRQSISQFIREYRLERAMELLGKGELTAAEVGYNVGFGSSTYFNKCFTELYGFPPGEAKRRITEKRDLQNVPAPQKRSLKRALSKYLRWQVLTAAILLLAIALTGINFFLRNEKKYSDKSIAILPFRNLSEDQGNEYFSDGIGEAIRTGLSRVEELRVISRTSVEQYRQSDKRASAIARELGVSTLLEGSIQRNDNQIRIEVRLVDGNSEVSIWANTFDCTLKDVFVIQNKISEDVAQQLHARVSPEEKQKLLFNGTNNPKAYDLYLKAIYEFRTYTNRGAHNSIELLTEAIRLDSTYARAYALLAFDYIGLATIWGAELGALEALQKGKPYIDKALALDPRLEEAHMLLGFYKLFNDWDFEGADAEYQLGIAGGHPDALAMYIDFLNFRLRHTEAMKYAEYLNEKDPYYPNSRIVLSYIYNDRLAEALEFSKSRLMTFSNYYTFDSHGFLLLYMKRYDEAITFFQKAIDVEGRRYPRILGWMGAAYAKSGRKAEAKKIIEEFVQRLENDEKTSISFFIAVIYSAMDEKALALKWLQRAYDTHEMEMLWLMTEPQFYNLHQEPDFLAIAKKMGFK